MGKAATPVLSITRPPQRAVVHDPATDFCHTCGMADQRRYTLHEIADFRGEFHAIADKLATVELQLDQLAQKIPTRKEHARDALGIILVTALLTMLAVLCFSGYWHFRF